MCSKKSTEFTFLNSNTFNSKSNQLKKHSYIKQFLIRIFQFLLLIKSTFNLAIRSDLLSIVTIFFIKKTIK